MGTGTPDPDSLPTFMAAVSARVAATSVPQDSADHFKSYLQGIADFMSAQGIYAETGVSETYNSVWGELNNGATYIVVLNRFPVKPDSTAAAKSAWNYTARAAGKLTKPVAGPLTAKAWYERTEIPAVPRAFLGYCLSSRHTDTTPTLKQWCLDKGYMVNDNPQSAGTVDDLKNISGAGIVYITTHGGGGIIDRIKRQPGFCLQTNTLVTKENQELYQDDLADKSLVLVSNPGDDTARYAITAKFVKKYMKFSANSFVFIDACYSDDPEFKQACLDAGASLYLGWTGPVLDYTSVRAVTLLFDRMLGINSIADSVYPELKYRPFDYMHTYSNLALRKWNGYFGPDESLDGLEGLETKGLIIIPVVNTIRLMITEGNGGCGLLVPSIQCLYVKENPPGAKPATSELNIYGTFGADPGEAGRSVDMEGTPLVVTSWTSTKILCEIPDYGTGSVGGVRVTNGGRKSNTVPLTEYLVYLTYRYEPGKVPGADPKDTDSRYDKIDLTCRLRYDVHGYVPALATNIIYYYPPDYDNLNPIPNHLNLSSSGKWVSGGDYYDYETKTVPNPDDPAGPDVQVQYLAAIPYGWSGGGNLWFGDLRESAANLFADVIIDSPSAKIRPAAKIILEKKILRFHLVLTAHAGGKIATEIIPPGGSGTPLITSLPVGFTQEAIDVVVDDNWYVKPDNVTRNGITLQWSGAAPRFIPTNDTCH